MPPLATREVTGLLAMQLYSLPLPLNPFEASAAEQYVLLDLIRDAAKNSKAASACLSSGQLQQQLHDILIAPMHKVALARPLPSSSGVASR